MSMGRALRDRPLSRFVVLAMAFAAGLLVERSGRLLTPYYYTPSGVERTFAPFWQAWDLVDRYYVDRQKVNPVDMTRGAIEGMLASLGDVGHTTYLSPEEVKQLNRELNGEHLEGIGAMLGVRQRRPVILYTLPGSPAREAGLRPGDTLVEVEGKQVLGMALDRLVALVHGPAATTVHLRVLRTGTSKPLDFAITRAQVPVPQVSWRLLPSLPIAHVAIHEFGKEADAQLQSALEEATKEGARALVVDVRGNRGGLKDQAVTVTSEFLPGGNVFLEQDARGDRKPVPVVPGGHASTIPVSVLIDEGTASSAEIFAGALQDHHRGQLVGTRTFGTGTVLGQFPLRDGSAVLLAIDEWLTPDGRQIWHRGIQPDIPVTLPEDALILFPESEVGLDAAALAKTQDRQLLKAIDVVKAQVR